MSFLILEREGFFKGYSKHPKQEFLSLMVGYNFDRN
jgi:hypothetical protein